MPGLVCIAADVDVDTIGAVGVCLVRSGVERTMGDRRPVGGWVRVGVFGGSARSSRSFRPEGSTRLNAAVETAFRSPDGVEGLAVVRIPTPGVPALMLELCLAFGEGLAREGFERVIPTGDLVDVVPKPLSDTRREGECPIA